MPERDQIAVTAPFDSIDFRQNCRIRDDLEALSTKKSATCIDENDINDLEFINERLLRFHVMPEPVVRAIRGVDFEFHQRLRVVAGLPLLATMFYNFADRSEGYRAGYLDFAHIRGLLVSAMYPFWMPWLSATQRSKAN